MLAVVFAVALVCSLATTPLIIRMATALEIFDAPFDSRRVHTRPVPRIGGLAVFAAMLSSLLVSWGMWSAGWGVAPAGDRFFLGVLLGATILFSIGLLDDLRGVSPAAKVLAQCAAALIAYTLGFRIEVLGLGPTLDVALGWLSLPLTVFWVVGVTNAFNLIDGLDGLAAGIALVALGTTLAVALVLGNDEVVIVCVVLVGALLGFLRYNFSPARIFLGDSGSLFIGFMLAVLSVHGSMKSATVVLVAVPIFALALPLLDTSLAILRRWLRGVPLSVADAHHVHHRLIALGFSHRRATVVMYLVASILAAVGLSLALAPPAMVSMLALVGGITTVALLIFGTRQLGYHEFTVAAMEVIAGLLRARRSIQDLIHARDIAQMIRGAQSPAQVDAVLESSVGRMGFLQVEVCPENAEAGRRPPLASAAFRRAWKVEFPVRSRCSRACEPYVLRIWCCAEQSGLPLGAERVARILAPAIEGWLLEHGFEPSALETNVCADARVQELFLDVGKADGVISLPRAAGRAVKGSVVSAAE